MMITPTMILMVIDVDVAAWVARESASHPSLLCREAISFMIRGRLTREI